MTGHILIIRGGGLGDLVLTLPAIRLALESGNRVTLAANPAYRSLATLLPGLGFLSLEGRETAPLFRDCPAAETEALLAPYDAAWVFRRSADEPPLPLLRTCLPAGTHHFPTPPPHARAADWPHPAPLWRFHLERAAALLGVPGLLPAPPESFRRTEVLLFPHTGAGQKNWPHKNWLELAALLVREGRQTRFVIHPEADPVPFHPHACLQEQDLTMLAAQLAGAGCCVGGDTGLSQLAAYRGAPLVMLFGPTDPALWGPPGKARILKSKGGDLRQLPVRTVLELVRKCC